MRSQNDRRVNATYPPGTARRLLPTDLVTPKTRDVLENRLAMDVNRDKSQPRFFTRSELAALEAACARLIPQPDREQPLNLAGEIDRRLAAGESNGWRYDRMPPDGEAYRRGLRGLDETARAMVNAGSRPSEETRFTSLDASMQDAVLAAAQRGDAPGEAWKTMPSPRFFEELLAEIAEVYYSCPQAQDEIGFTGFADAHGWQRIGLDRLEPFEPRAIDGRSEEVLG